MICFFWDLTSLHKSAMKSSGFGWARASAVELLGGSFLADDEFCANTGLVAANMTSIRVITKKFFWFTDSFLTAKVLPAIVDSVNSPACTIPIEQHCVSFNRSRSRCRRVIDRC